MYNSRSESDHIKIKKGRMRIAGSECNVLYVDYSKCFLHGVSSTRDACKECSETKGLGEYEYDLKSFTI